MCGAHLTTREYYSRFSLRRVLVKSKQYVYYILSRKTAGSCIKCDSYHPHGSSLYMFLSGPDYTELTERDCDAYNLSSICTEKEGLPYTIDESKMGRIIKVEGMKWVQQEEPVTD